MTAPAGPPPSDHVFLIGAACEAGWDAFWAAVAKSVGARATTGDLTPMEQVAFSLAVKAAVTAWVKNNVAAYPGDSDDFVRSLGFSAEETATMRAEDLAARDTEA